MKKIMLVLFVLGISLSSFAGLKEKNVIGTWKYKVETDQGVLTGTMTIEKRDGKLTGEVNSDDGETLAITKIEIKEDDLLIMELDNGYEAIDISVTVKGKVFKGTVGTDQGSFPITAEKIE
jgi:hypothetical protein